MKTETEAGGAGVWRRGNSHKFFCKLWNCFFFLSIFPASSSNLNDSMLAAQLCMKSNNTNSSTMRHKWNFPLESPWKSDNRRCVSLVFFWITDFCSGDDCCSIHISHSPSPLTGELCCFLNWNHFHLLSIVHLSNAYFVFLEHSQQEIGGRGC